MFCKTVCETASVLCLILVAAWGDVYVSPTGSDTNPGTEAEPFATLGRARDRLRELRTAGQLRQGTTVWLRGGTYFMDKPLELTHEDSCTADCPVTFAAYRDEKPIISAGRRIVGWRPGGNGLWKAEIPEVKNRKWYFHQLFTRAPHQGHSLRRYRPSKGFFVVAGLTDAPHLYPNARVGHRNPQNEFYFHKGDIQRWENLDDVEVVAMHDWSSGRLHIESIDFDENVVRFTDYPHYRIGHWYPGGRNPYLIENLKEELGKPGQWYLDRPTGTLYYRPADGEDMGGSTVIAPRLEHLVLISGDREGGRYVEHVAFRGLTFAHTAWRMAPHKYAEQYGRRCRQGVVDMPSAIELKWARNCRFERCTMAHLGSYAIDLGEGCHDNAVVGNRIFDIGAGGVKVGVVNRKAEPPVVTTGNVIANNIVSDIGLVHYSAHGIWGGITAKTLISHNVVRRTLYSSIAVGWSHSTRPTACRENIMEHNHVYDVLLLLDHGGALYTLGNQPGTIIRGNLIHDTYQTKLHGNTARPVWAGGALGFDDGSSDFTVEQNVIYNTPSDPALPLKSRRAGDMNIGVNYCGVRPGEDGFPAALAAKAGLEPAYRDLLEVPFKLTPPPVLSMRLPKDLKPVKIVDTFERSAVGRKPRRGYPRVEDKKPGRGTDAIVVTGETAAAGKHCLKIVDAPGLSRTWIPYLSYAPKYNAGLARVSLDLRIEDGVVLDHSWRGAARDREFSVGPQFMIKEGKLLVGEEELMPIPVGQWVHFEITARLGEYDPGIGGAGKEEYGSWTLAVILPDQEPRIFERLKNRSEEFRDLRWVGFISCAERRTVFYLDNVAISNE